jgi:hypothetical protein
MANLKEIRGLLSPIGLEAGAIRLVKGLRETDMHVQVASKMLQPLAKSITRMMQRMMPLGEDGKPVYFLKEMPRGQGGRSGFAETLAVYHLTLHKTQDTATDETPTYTSWDALIPGPAPTQKKESPFKSGGWLSLSKVSTEERLVTGVVLEPEVVDGTRTVDPETGAVEAIGDIYSEEEIRQAMYWWMENGGAKFAYNHTGKMGGRFLVAKADVSLLECWQTRENVSIGGQNILKGAWIITARVNNLSLWNDIKTGVIKSFSIEAAAMGKIERVKDPVLA